jgi:hypothetical protein
VLFYQTLFDLLIVDSAGDMIVTSLKKIFCESCGSLEIVSRKKNVSKK